MKLFISPHNDDEVLFGAFTLMREKPLVVLVTDSFIQPNRGEKGCDAETRRKETIEACKVLGCPVIFLGLRDDTLNEDELLMSLARFTGFEKVYTPALQGGNKQHDMVNRVTHKLFDNVVEYTTYTPTELHTTGSIEVKPTEEEMDLKIKLFKCYQSQLNLNTTRPHFQSVMGKSEYYV